MAKKRSPTPGLLMDTVKVYNQHYVQASHIHVKSINRSMLLIISCGKFGPLVQFYSSNTNQPYFQSFSEKTGDAQAIMDAIDAEYELPLNVRDEIINYLNQKTKNVKASVVAGVKDQSGELRGDANVWG